MALIELKNIHKTYKLGKTLVPALKGVNLSLEKGELTVPPEYDQSSSTHSSCQEILFGG